jgi:peptide-methionine (S)-S-oxide reductase
MDIDENMEIAILAGGCFWCLEAVFEQLDGVVHVESGYIGGHVVSPTYEEVCGGRTGHAEAVRIFFKSENVSYKELLEIFFSIHDPTTLNKQGPDTGTQYRSAVFVSTSEQEAIAVEVIESTQESGLFTSLIVTEIDHATEFYIAENYHQEYYRSNAYQSYCQIIIDPKVAKFKKEYKSRLKREYS